VLDVAAVHAWCRDALDALGAAREEIDALNVYPVPDGDTGTNLFLTTEAAVEELSGRPDDGDLHLALRALAHGALLGARGNSGVILSQLGRGAVEAVVTATPHDGGPGDGAALLAAALASAADAAYAAVARPVEGTILTVARAAADASRAAVDDGGTTRVAAHAAASAAREALARTPDQLEPLRRAGVVDAGGRGLTVLLDALVRAVTGERPMSEPPRAAMPQPRRAEPGVDREGDGPAYEVMYLLEADDAATATLRDELAAMGESLLVVGGDGLWNVHVHVDDVGPAIEAGVRAGRPYRIRVTHVAEQVARQRVGRELADRAVVALLPGDGLADLARASGALVVRSTAGRRPATRDVVEAVQQAHAGEVVVLPDDRDTLAVAEAAAEYARGAGLRVAVIPTRAPVQVLAALAVHDGGRRFEDDVVAMAAAARATRTGAVTVAVRESLTSAGVCRAGDVLGLVDGDVVLIGDDLGEVAAGILARMLTAGGELVTVVLGTGAEDLGPLLESRLRRTNPEAEVHVHLGGQELYPVLVGVE
jgi:DAK2 domain fusion protein YloV